MTSEQDWLYYRVGVGGPVDLQAVLHDIVPDLVRSAKAEMPTGSWFFLRFADLTGLHLRIRFRGPLKALAAFEKHADQVWHEAQRSGQLIAHSARGRLRPWEKPPITHIGVSKSLYEREIVKYGGRRGVDAAEDFFAASSEAAVSLFDERYWPRRLAHACLATSVLLAALSQVELRTWLSRYRTYWTGFRNPAPADLEAALPKVAQRHRDAITADLLSLVHDRVHLRWGTVTDFAERASQVADGRRPQELLWHFVHTNNNRLGLTSYEEALLAQLLLDGVTDSALLSG